MIITRTPFRISFIGGGTDLRDFYSKNGYGAVISTAIKKYVYITIHPYFHDKIRIKYSRTEDVKCVEDIEHPIVRECLRKVNIGKGMEIASFADVPAGTGLGSSSAFTVGLLHALYTYEGKTISKEKLAQDACDIEINILGEPIGKQDQYAAAYGNVNLIKFNSNESVEVIPLLLTESVENMIEQSLRLYYTGIFRKTRNILLEQKANMGINEKFNLARNLLFLLDDFKIALNNGEINQIGNILHKGWLNKKLLSGGISNDYIDELYGKAMNYGATGGKLLGSGGGGFLLLQSNDHKLLEEKLNCRMLPVNIDHEGSKLLFYE
ncbi:MAG: GHMP kinase [Desulfobacterales bacterium]|nr:GHMP kinase [Desulfobacterales bacterium]